EYAMDCLIWSYTRPVEKLAKVPVNGILPPMVRPAARPIILASAMPTWKKRSGNSFRKSPILSEPIRSAQSPTTFGLARPASRSPTPKPERVSFFSVYVNFFILIISQGFFQLCQRLFQLLVARGDAVPFVRAFHKVDAFAHDRIHQDHDGFAFSGQCLRIF